MLMLMLMSNHIKFLHLFPVFPPLWLLVATPTPEVSAVAWIEPEVRSDLGAAWLRTKIGFRSSDQ